MTITNRLALVLALALGATAVGCGSDPSSMGDDDGGGDDQPRVLDASGTYTMTSTFDLATNMPGTAGTVVNTIIAATDNADDPTRWVVDQIIAQLPNGDIKSALNFGKELIIGYVHQQFLQYAPDFVQDVAQVGHDFGDIAKHFSLKETFELTKIGNDYTAVHSVVGVHYKLGNQEGDFLLSNYHVTNVVVPNVSVTMDKSGQLTIAAHSIAVPYGKLLKLGLDAAIVPLIDSSARTLNDLLAHKVDCRAIANAIASRIGFGAGTIEGACIGGLQAAANYVYAKIDEIDRTALQFALNGSARGVDKNNDRRIDTLQTGTWSGTLAYGATPTPLLPATFSGERN